MLDAGSSQVSEQLCGMLVRECLAGFQFHEKNSFDEKIGVEIAQDDSVLIDHLQRMLQNIRQPQLAQSVCQPRFIYLLQMPVPKMAVQSEAGLTYCIAQPEYVFFHISASAPFAPSCGQKSVSFPLTEHGIEQSAQDAWQTAQEFPVPQGIERHDLVQPDDEHENELVGALHRLVPQPPLGEEGAGPSAK